MASKGSTVSEAMVSALVVQDEPAFRQLVKSFHLPLKKLASSIVGDSVAEEVVQDAWISIYENLPKFERRSSLKTWIYRITANKAISRLRKESKSMAFSEIKNRGDGENDFDLHFDEEGFWQRPPAHWQENDPAKLLTGQELQDCIQRVLGRLPQLQGAVFTLNDIEGKTAQEICNILELSASNMRVLLHRARLKLFDHIDHFQETGEC